MKYLLIIVVIVLIAVVFLLFRDEDVYDEIKGHEVTPAIKRAEKKLKTRKPADKLKAADINRYNLKNQEEADRLYALALFEAINGHDPIAFAINDRIGGAPLAMPEAPIVQVRSDPQNVHDTNVTDGLQQKYERIRDGTPASHELVAEFGRTLNEKARGGFDHIINYPGTIDKLGVSDMELLYLIIGRNRDLWPPLATNLENIIQNDYAICTMGRAAQILDSLTLIDEEAGAPLVTTDIMRKEMMDHCSNYINKLSPEAREKYEDDPDADLNIMINQLQKKYPAGPVFNKIIEEIRMAFSSY